MEMERPPPPPPRPEAADCASRSLVRWSMRMSIALQRSWFRFSLSAAQSVVSRAGAQDAQRDVEAEEDQDEADAPHDDGHALEELLVEGRHGGREEQAEEREGQDQAEGRPNLHATAPALREQLQVEDESAARSRDEDVPLLVREVDVLAALEALLVRLHAAAQRTVRFSQHPWNSRAWP